MTNRGVIAVASFALLVGGCSSLGSSDGAGDTGDTANGATSPLAEFLGLGDVVDLGSEDSQAAIVELQRKNNEAVVACMAADGFDYIAPNVDENTIFGGETADGLRYGSPEYTARFGFGVTTEYWSASTVGPELVGYDERTNIVEAVDPNEAYLSSLSEADRDAYQRALLGDSVDYEWDPSLTNDENQTRADAFYADLEPSGCFAEAMAESGLGRAADFFSTFATELEAIDAAVEADPRIADTLRDIEDCVVEAGLVYVDPTDPFGHWEDELSDIAQNHVTQDASAVIDEEGLAKLARIQAEEIEIATATDECGGSQDDLRPLYESVTAEYEQRFLDDNADAIAEFEGDA